MSLNLSLSDVFMMRLSLYSFGQNITKETLYPSYNGYMMSICLITGEDINLEQLVNVVPAPFLHCEVTIFPCN